MLGENLTLKAIDEQLEALKSKPERENLKHAITTGDLLLVRQSFLKSSTHVSQEDTVDKNPQADTRSDS